MPLIFCRKWASFLAAELKALTLNAKQLQNRLYGAKQHRFRSKSKSMDQLQVFAKNEEIA